MDGDEESYEEIIDEAKDEIDETSELREGQLDSYSGTFPESKEKQDLYGWFWKVVRLKKPFQLAKVGNLDKDEIGKFPISVREGMNLWILGNTFHHPTFGNYFAQIAKITSATSMAKKGWFMDLSISQRRVRGRESNLPPSGNKNKKGRWRIFGKTSTEEAQGQSL